MNSIDTRFSRNVFEVVQKTRSTCFIGSKATRLRLVVLNPIKHSCSFFKHYIKELREYLVYLKGGFPLFLPIVSRACLFGTRLVTPPSFIESLKAPFTYSINPSSFFHVMTISCHSLVTSSVDSCHALVDVTTYKRITRRMNSPIILNLQNMLL